ncbi:hypothetical protein BD626DRAFT_634967 [Schizophyllum amplum]|uniref:BTB domain-containing protein n=1 Tax=Schizophyllum amplum TaxID=97359 RepID=A0A550BXR3_9AGAR|nr:hypothetical protein BD626DRAFT_634967 [Auriculariopsis ampla]
MASFQGCGDATETDCLPDRQSEKFSSTAGEIFIFRSSDRVLFNIHRVNLRAVTDGPFAEDFVSPFAEIVDLTEGSDILDVLFQFVYSGDLPTLDSIDHKRLCAIAEAAEKYRVAPARVVCHIRMELIYSSHPLEVIAYAYKHGYTELLDRTAPLSKEFSASKALNALGVGLLYIGWTTYKDAWAQIMTTGTYDIRMRLSHGTAVKCETWTSIVCEVERTLDVHRFKWLNSTFVSVLFQQAELTAACQQRTGDQTSCEAQLREWKTAAQRQADAIPPLSKFISSVQ